MAVVIDGTNGVSSPDYEVDGVTGQLYPIVSGTAQASTSGTSRDFTGIPSWVKRITVMFSGVSTSGTSVPLIQLGDSGGVENTGYLGASGNLNGAVYANYTAGFGINGALATNIYQGIVVLALLNASTNTWAASGNIARSDGAGFIVTAGSKSLSGVLDRVRITTVNGTDTFDAGTINILYE
jgi:hypothetical protein